MNEEASAVPLLLDTLALLRAYLFKNSFYAQVQQAVLKPEQLVVSSLAHPEFTAALMQRQRLGHPARPQKTPERASAGSEQFRQLRPCAPTAGYAGCPRAHPCSWPASRLALSLVRALAPGVQLTDPQGRSRFEQPVPGPVRRVHVTTRRR